MAECRLRPPKTSEEEEKCVATAIPKRMAFSVLGSLRTIPLHSTLAVNNLGLKFVP